MLEIRNLRKTFRDPAGGAWMLANNLNLTVGAGNGVAILGPSGSGKSTLLKIIAGLETADAGEIRFGGHDITHLPPEQRGFALMFQDFALFPHLDVRDNVAFGLIEHGRAKPAARQQALELLERFGLAAHARHPVWRLSGGEQQRVALARALITAPRLLLLDEPFSALDAELRATMREEFARRIGAAGTTALLVTHDEAEARALTRRAYRLIDGELVTLW